MDSIVIQGAKTHNLKNISLTIPRDKLVIITGLSGSGKSSLAFDTLYAEGQRRYVESLSAYARQFLSLMEKPDVEHIEGLSPAISIEQKSTSHNPRSTVGTITEIYDYLRLLFARVGEPHCPTHHIHLQAQTISQMTDELLALPEDTKMMLLAPVIRDRKGEHTQIFTQLRSQGFLRVRVDGELYELDDLPTLKKTHKHTIEVIVDRFKVRSDLKQRIAESLETALRLSDGLVYACPIDPSDSTPIDQQRTFSARYACPECDFSLPELEPRLFSFNNPAGACPECDGLGTHEFFDAAKIIADDKLSLSEGAIHGWDMNSSFHAQTLQALAAHFGFDVDTPWRQLSKKHRDILLYGSDEAVVFEYGSGRHHNGHRSVQRTHKFEGILPNLTRRYRESESGSQREELSKFATVTRCDACDGSRLNVNARCVHIQNFTLPMFTRLSIEHLYEQILALVFTGQKQQIASKILQEISARLSFLLNVGLEYLSLERTADTLSGGEAQRIRLASQIGAGLVGVMYVLDEPSIGLHQRDNARLIQTLHHLRDLGNSVIVVEHDEDAMQAADHIIDMGPGAGIHGGEVIAQGTLADIKRCKHSVTGQFLSGRRSIAVPTKRVKAQPKAHLVLRGARGNNLNNVTLELPVGLFTCITGVSGSGKSTLINRTLYPLAASALNGASTLEADAHDSIEGLSYFDKVIDINQSPIGRTPRSNPATYTGIFTPVRELFAGTPEARARGYKPGRFSFNVRGGRCEACEGDGLIKVEMHFLADMYVTCDACQGRRYNRETLGVTYKNKNIHQVLDLTIEDAYEFFAAIPSLARKLQTLIDVGLSYIRLGQAATTLSGGEAQRVKLAKELSKRDTGNTLYILDEPTTGLHFHDIEQLLKVLHKLRDAGNTIVVIEHNLDVIKTADWVIDLGPEGGAKGGHIIATGTPEQLAAQPHSYTGHFLAPLLTQQTIIEAEAAF
jgi:excinuclease ABC subunit A